MRLERVLVACREGGTVGHSGLEEAPGTSPITPRMAGGEKAAPLGRVEGKQPVRGEPCALQEGRIGKRLGVQGFCSKLHRKR
jgi:hypothetical protein